MDGMIAIQKFLRFCTRYAVIVQRHIAASVWLIHAKYFQIISNCINVIAYPSMNSGIQM